MHTQTITLYYQVREQGNIYPCPVSASIEGELALHSGIHIDAEKYVITHVQSGRKVLVCDNLLTAHKALAELAAVPGWESVTPGTDPAKLPVLFAAQVNRIVARYNLALAVK
jgi:hypothetical protein